MNDGVFQWDDSKAAANHAKHGVTFEAARDAFKDPFALDWIAEGPTKASSVSPRWVWSKTACCSLPTP
jgi:uncharacterized DUF497 family protein